MCKIHNKTCGEKENVILYIIIKKRTDIMKDKDKVIRQNNDLLNLLRFYKGIDKSEMSRRMGVSIPTVYNAVEDLLDAKVVVKDESKTLSINEDYAILVGISIGSSLCKVTFLNLNFEVFESQSFINHKNSLIERIETVLDEGSLPLDRTREYVWFQTPRTLAELKMVLDIVFEYIENCVVKNIFKVLSLGISCTGIINDEKQTILDAYNLSYLNGLTIDTLIYPGKQTFFKENDIKISLVQNSNASVLAEKIRLCQKRDEFINTTNIISIYLGTGIGAGMYLGKLYIGSSGYAGETGHTKAPRCESEKDMARREELVKQGKVDAHCTCGCDDCYDYKIRTYVFEKTASEFCKMSSDDIENYLHDHEDKAELLGKYLGNIVNTLTSYLNIDLIVFTGKFYKSMKYLLNAIDSVRDESPLRYSRTDCKIVTSEYGSLAPAIGAAIYSYYRKFDLEMILER